MNYTHLLLACCLMGQTAAYAQKPAAATEDIKPKSEAEKLMEEYRFEEAVELLEKDIATAERRRKPTETLEALKAKALTGLNMLNATARVTFVDSLVVDKARFLTRMSLSADIGQLMPCGESAPGMPGKAVHGQGLFVNELGDKAYYALADSAGTLKLHHTEMLGDTWRTPTPLEGLAGLDGAQDFPFVLTDGVTLYYASQSEEGLGGYDLYVTRYSLDEGSYLKPENLGMPFNSPANDYLYAVDEANNLGWFVTDRAQPEGKVCIYVFVPADTRDTYTPLAFDDDEIRDFARISSIAATQKNAAEVADAKNALQRARTAPKQATEEDAIHFVVGDGRIYTSAEQFRSAEARKLCAEWIITHKHMTKQEKQLDALRLTYARSEEAQRQQMAPTILQLEKEVEALEADNKQLEARMRTAELPQK